MAKKQNAKGQIYSLDFLIAAGLLVLAIGMLLNYYETSTYQAKEARTKNELNAIALTAGNIISAKANCAETAFGNQGYLVYGCIDPDDLSTLTKGQLLVPFEFKCQVMLNNSQKSGCSDILSATKNETDVAIVQKNILTITNPATTLSKESYDKCISNNGCSGVYSESILLVKVWRA